MANPSPDILSGRVVIDDADFTEVVFRNATLAYSGGRTPNFVRCKFERVTFSFEGPAAETVQLLRKMAPTSTNMRGVVLGLLPELAD